MAILKKYLLIGTDGYSIDTTPYLSLEKAHEAMKKAYNHFCPKDNGEEWEESSYINDTDAILYANGDKVYVWNIYPVEFQFDLNKETTKEQMKSLKDGTIFQINNALHIANGDAHLSGDSTYDGYIVYDEEYNSWFEDDFPEENQLEEIERE